MLEVMQMCLSDLRLSKAVWSCSMQAWQLFLRMWQTRDDWISAWAPLLASQAEVQSKSVHALFSFRASRTCNFQWIEAAVSGLPLCLKPARPASEASAVKTWQVLCCSA